MQHRRLGVAGPELSLVGLGCNNFGMKIDEQEAAGVVQAALDGGITHFDTAESYGGGHSEVFLGKALGARRDEVVIATKFAPRPPEQAYRPGLLRRRILDGCDTSLKRIGTDRIDLYYQHRPDPVAPVQEALEALAELVDAGKVVHVACSNFSSHQIDDAASISAAKGLPGFIASQIHWNLLFREAEEEIVPAIRRHLMGIVPYLPLEAGLLTGKYRPGRKYPEGSRLATMRRYAALGSEQNLSYVEELRRFAEERGHSLLELAFGWLAAQDGVASVIAGATTPEQVAQNARAGQAWRLSATDLEELPRMG